MLGKLRQHLLRADARATSYGPEPPPDIRGRPQLILLIPLLRQPSLLPRQSITAALLTFPKAVAKITGDREELLAFYDFPAEHWIHLRTMNSVESTFSTVKLRTKVTRGAGSPTAALAMVFKLVESAQDRWRAITGAHLVVLVRSGAKFVNGALVERSGTAQLPDW